MSEQETRARDQLDQALKVGTVALVVITIISVALYWYSLDRSLSSKPEDWSAFGSYIGGILGPAISFVALIAVLRTISLQREAAALQRQQFLQLDKIQQETLAAQRDQLGLAKQSAEQENVLGYKTAVLKVVEHQIAYYTDAAQRLERRLEMLQMQATSMAMRKPMEEVAGQRDVAQARINGLQDFVMEFMLKEHSTIHDIQIDVRDKLIAAFAV